MHHRCEVIINEEISCLMNDDHYIAGPAYKAEKILHQEILLEWIHVDINMLATHAHAHTHKSKASRQMVTPAQ